MGDRAAVAGGFGRAKLLLSRADIAGLARREPRPPFARRRRAARKKSRRPLFGVGFRWSLKVREARGLKSEAFLRPPSATATDQGDAGRSAAGEASEKERADFGDGY